MAWSYRKRVRIAPGVHLNLSRRGVSTTGVRGASVNFGKKGTYVNTGIPGTGFYNRQKISGGRGRPHASVKRNIHTSPSGGGQLLGYGCAGILALLFLFMGLIWLIEEKQIFTGIIFLSFALYVVVGAILINTSISAKPKAPSINWVDQAKRMLPRTSGTARSILQNFIQCYELAQQIDEESAIVQGLEKKLSKKPNEQLERLLKDHRGVLTKRMRQLEATQINVDTQLSEEEKAAYSRLCERFEALLSTDKIWLITDEVLTTQRKAFSNISIKRCEASIYVGVFNFLKSAFDIPVLDSGDARYYIYPKFIIKATDVCHFYVYPHDPDGLTAATVNYQESEARPVDAEFLKYTWQYVNKNGEPDKRYANNLRYPVFKYCCLFVNTGNTTAKFMFSNYTTASEFATAYTVYANLLTAPNTTPTEPAPEVAPSEPIPEAVPTESILKAEPKTPVVSVRGFSAIERETTNLYLYIKSLDSMAAVREALRKHTALDFAEEIKFTVSGRLAFAVWIDVLKCYKKLGYEIDPSKEECIALSVFVAELYLPDALMLEMSEDKMVEVLPATKRLVSMTEEVYPFTEPDDELLFVKVLRADGVDEAIVNKYMALLHQFVSVVVKADGRVDEQEKTWLKQLKTFTPLENRVVLKGPVTR